MDLRRVCSSYLWYGLFAGAFLQRSFAATDGLLSIRCGFLPAELEALLAGAAPALVNAQR